MAELLGLVSAGAGLASLAFQLGESAVKARRLYLAIKGAPENLRQLAFEMETFSVLLHGVARQAQAHDSGDADILLRCVHMCEQSVTRIKATVDKLDSLTCRHSRFGMLKAAVDDKELSQMCVDLERAKASLGVALQLYSEYQRAKDRELLLANYKLASEQTRLLQTHFDSTVTLRTDPLALPPPYSATVLVETSLDDTNAANRRRCYSNLPAKQFSLQLKPWFTSTIWELCICKSFAGWDFRLRAMNVVPDDAEIFYRCRDGDLDGVRRMFQDGLASPHDQSPYGYHSVLKDAMLSRDMELCRFVVESLDNDVVDVDDFHQSLGAYAWTSRFAGDCLNDSGSVDMYRLLVSHMDLTEDTFLQGQWWEWSRNLECMKLAQNAMLTPYMDLPWRTRFEHAMELAVSEGNFTAEMFLQSLGGDPFVNRLATSKTADGLTVSHALAMAAGSRTLAQLEIGSWVDLARGYVASGGSFHCQDNNGSSPLTYILDDGIHACQRTPCKTTRLRTWIHLLKSVGVDLTLYGQEEANSWQNTIDNRGHGGVYAHEQVVEKWSFGPEPEDWSLIFRKVSYAQVYVALAAPNVPGTWDAIAYGQRERPRIVWNPVQEDEAYLPRLTSWTEERSMKLVSRPFITTGPQDQHVNEAFNHCINFKAQDDASEIMRLLDTTRRPISRPRSRSQPRFRDQRNASQTFDHIANHEWLPTYHICVCDSKRRLAPCDFNDAGTWLTAFRRCMRGHHQEADIWKYIDRRMRHFRRQFRTREELQRLPYKAYKDDSWQYNDWRENIRNYYYED